MNKDKKEEKKPQGKGMGWRVKLAMLIIFVAALVFYPTTMVFFIMMVPTFVAFVIDRTRQKSFGMTVGVVNFSGVIPAWIDLWQRGHTFKQAIIVGMDPSFLLVAYAAAGIGWIIYSNVTPFVSRLIVRKTERRVKEIEKRQKELIRRWGKEVSGEVAPAE